MYVEGSLRTRKWTDKDGQEKYSTEIRADNMQMLGSRQGAGGPGPAGGGGDQGGGDEGYGYEQQAPRRPAPASRPPSAAPAPRQAPAKSSTGFEDMDDDIPF